MTQYTKVWQLLEDKKRWTKKNFAKDSSGGDVHPTNPKAVCWCLFGAVRKIYGCWEDPKSKLLELHIYTPWNDDPERTHAEVLALCKELDI